MKFVEEVVVDEFLPTFRSMLAEDLRRRGLTQSEVGEVLGVSQSAVSKYVHGDVGRNPTLEGDERVQSLVERVGEGLASGDVSQVGALAEAEVLVRELEAPGDVLARLHAEAMPALAEYEGEFRIHDAEGAVRTRERVLASVRRGLRTLENTGGVASLVPNVGSNLVECLPDAAGVDDVAGVPGRLVDVKGRVAIPADPEFGASATVATLLLAARAAGSEARAAVNLRYDPDLVATLEDAGHDTAAFDPEEPLEAAVAEALAETPGATVLYQTGAYRVEPILYVLGPSAADVASVVRDLA